jgi:hypothetical protein
MFFLLNKIPRFGAVQNKWQLRFLSPIYILFWKANVMLSVSKVKTKIISVFIFHLIERDYWFVSKCKKRIRMCIKVREWGSFCTW